MEKKEAIFILGGGLIKDNGKWRTTNFDEPGDNFGTLGDRLRVLAADVMYKRDPELLLIPSCGKGQYKDISDAPAVAEVIKKELIELGIPINSIIKEEKSGNTWQQLQQFKKIINQQGFSKASFLSNRHHLPRVQAMIEVDDDLNKMLAEGKIGLVSAEEVLIEHDAAKWEQYINDAYQSKAVKKRIALEKEGVKQIRERTYKYE